MHNVLHLIGVLPIITVPEAQRIETMKTATVDFATVKLATNVGKAVCDDGSRYAMASVLAARNGSSAGVAVATDGRCLAICEADVHCADNGMIQIPGKSIAARSAGRDVLVRDNRAEYDAGSKAKPKIVVDALPDQDHRFPPVAAILRHERTDERTAWITLNADLLMKLAEAISSKKPGERVVALGVKLDKTYDGTECAYTTKPIIVEPVGDHDGMSAGLLMPAGNDWRPGSKYGALAEKACDILGDE